MIILFIIILFYFIGSIPTGYIFARFKGIDIKKRGSGNTGGTNVGRVLGLKYGVLIVVLDAMKGYIPLLIVKNYFSNEIIFILGLSIILGHIFSVFLHFKGGKGIATMIGLAFIFLPVFYILTFILIWYGIVISTRYMSLSNLLIIWGFPAYFIFFENDRNLILLSLVLVAILYYTHRENIKRLTSGTEKKLGSH
jgi:glycerol-3-phosphate acyltransferase PlsY